MDSAQLQWTEVPNMRKLVPVNRSQTIIGVMLLLTSAAVCQTAPDASDCSTLKYLRHKVSCLCGTVQVCSGDLCGRPSDYDLDDDITVELRERSGTILDSKKVAIETREIQERDKDLLQRNSAEILFRGQT